MLKRGEAYDRPDVNDTTVWRLGRIVDRSRPEQSTYDVDLIGGGKPAILSSGYASAIGDAPAGHGP